MLNIEASNFTWIQGCMVSQDNVNFLLEEGGRVNSGVGIEHLYIQTSTSIALYYFVMQAI